MSVWGKVPPETKQEESEMTDFIKKGSYELSELEGYAKRIHGTDIPPLPDGFMLMLHNILDISETGGEYGRGYAVAVCDLSHQKPIFDCHFAGSPLLPGCTMVDGILQLAGFMLAWRGARGQRGAALGMEKVKFKQIITPDSGKIIIRIDVSSVRIATPLSLIHADGAVYEGNKVACSVSHAKVAIGSS